MPFEIIEHPKFSKLIKKISKKHKTIHDDLATAKDILSKEPDIMADYIPGFLERSQNPACVFLVQESARAEDVE